MVYRQHQLSGSLEKSLGRQLHRHLLLWVLTGWGPPLFPGSKGPIIPSTLKTQLLVPSPLSPWTSVGCLLGRNYGSRGTPLSKRLLPRPPLPDALSFSAGNRPPSGHTSSAGCLRKPPLSQSQFPFPSASPLHSNSRPSTYQISIAPACLCHCQHPCLCAACSLGPTAPPSPAIMIPSPAHVESLCSSPWTFKLISTDCLFSLCTGGPATYSGSEAPRGRECSTLGQEGDTSERGGWGRRWGDPGRGRGLGRWAQALLFGLASQWLMRL